MGRAASGLVKCLVDGKGHGAAGYGSRAGSWHRAHAPTHPAGTCGSGAGTLVGSTSASSWLASSCGSDWEGSAGAGAAATAAAATALAAVRVSLLRGALEELPGERDGLGSWAAAPAAAASVGLAAGLGLAAAGSSAAGDSCSSCSCTASMLQLSWAPTLGSGARACTCRGSSGAGC